MVSMYLLIPLSLMLFVIGIWAVRWAVKSNQFDDLDNAAQRVILDDRQERRQALNQKTTANSANPNNKSSSKDSNKNSTNPTNIQSKNKNITN